MFRRLHIISRGALPTLEAIPPSPLKALPTALRSSDMLLLVENLVSPLMLLLSYSISEQLRSLLLCKASLPTPPELEVVASKALCKGFPDISCNVTPMLMGSATCAAPIPRTPTQPGSKGCSIVMAPVSTFTLNSERSLPPEMEYRNIPLGPSSRSEALTVKIVEPIGSFSGTITCFVVFFICNPPVRILACAISRLLLQWLLQQLLLSLLTKSKQHNRHIKSQVLLLLSDSILMERLRIPQCNQSTSSIELLD
uniref:Uncharacterized protein n=1 Tax=Glossina austeni TaxID=7395 RepID=A0A1A9UMU7_GLOAU